MSNRILSYRGRLADNGLETILLSTKKGEVGYRITKLQIIQKQPGGQSSQLLLTIWKTDPEAAVTEVDFSDNRMLAVAYRSEADVVQVNEGEVIIFDQEIFNQDIFIRASDIAGTQPTNYYLELEVVKLSEDQAMVATLKDIKNSS